MTLWKPSFLPISPILPRCSRPGIDPWRAQSLIQMLCLMACFLQLLKVMDVTFPWTRCAAKHSHSPGAVTDECTLLQTWHRIRDEPGFQPKLSPAGGYLHALLHNPRLQGILTSVFTSLYGSVWPPKDAAVTWFAGHTELGPIPRECSNGSQPHYKSVAIFKSVKNNNCKQMQTFKLRLVV